LRCGAGGRFNRVAFSVEIDRLPLATRTDHRLEKGLRGRRCQLQGKRQGNMEENRQQGEQPARLKAALTFRSYSCQRPHDGNITPLCRVRPSPCSAQFVAALALLPILAAKSDTKRQREEKMAEYEDLLYEVKGRVAVLTLNRPDRLNAWTGAMERSVKRAMAAAVADDNVRVIVLTGAGRGFCAGADMGLLQQIEARKGEERPGESEETFDFASGLGPDVSPHYGGRFGYLLQVKKP